MLCLQCLIHYDDSEKHDGVWKDCTAVVTPYRSFNPSGEPKAMKRVSRKVTFFMLFQIFKLHYCSFNPLESQRQ